MNNKPIDREIKVEKTDKWSHDGVAQIIIIAIWAQGWHETEAPQEFSHYEIYQKTKIS